MAAIQTPEPLQTYPQDQPLPKANLTRLRILFLHSEFLLSASLHLEYPVHLPDQPPCKQNPFNATNIFKGHPKSFWQIGGLFPSQQSLESQFRYGQLNQCPRSDVPASQPRTVKAPSKPQTENGGPSVTELLGALLKVENRALSQRQIPS